MTLSPDLGTPFLEIGFLSHRIGDRIKDRYDVLERLGGGNFGSVYRVLDSAVGNVLACKEMHVLDNPNTPDDERAAALDLFKREALNLATLRHPHIPAAYFDQEEGHWNVCPICGLDFPDSAFCPEHGKALLPVSTRFYLMMDFVDGPTLEALAEAELRSKGRALDEEKCLEWTHQIASALRTLHRVGIIHRDIKPENIKIRRDDETAILLDFGLTKKVGEASGYGTAPMTGTARFGTVGYAPENPQERDHPEKRSDIHALGMTLYRLLSGRDPQNYEDLREMRAHSPRFFNAEVSPETDALVRGAIASDLDSRFQSIDDFLKALDAIRLPESSGASIPAFTFASGERARSGSELARLIEKNSEEATQYLFNGMLATWLLQNGFPAPARAAEQVVKVHAQNPPRALELFRRTLFPTGTAHVLPRIEVEPAALNFGAIDSGARVEAVLTIKNSGPGLLWGKIGVPPRQKPGQTGLASAVKSILAGGQGDEESSLPGLICPNEFQGNDTGIEILIDSAKVANGAYSSHLLLETDAGFHRVPVSFSVVPLELKTEPETLDFGSILVGKREVRELRVVPVRSSNGTPRGTLYSGANLGVLSAPERFEGAAPLQIVVDASSPSAVARLYDGLLQLDTNGGRLRVPVRYRITLPPTVLAGIIALATTWGTLSGAALRVAYSIINPEYATRWLLEFQNGQRTLTNYEFRGLGPLIVGAIFGIYGGWLLSRRMKKIAPRDRPGMLKNSDANVLHTLPMLGLVFGAFGGYLGASVLHWTLWSFGDWLLYAIARDLGGPFGKWAQSNAPVMWGVAGGIIGLMWGIGRALSTVGRGEGRNFFIVFLITAALALLLNATLQNV